MTCYREVGIQQNLAKLRECENAVLYYDSVGQESNPYKRIKIYNEMSRRYLSPGTATIPWRKFTDETSAQVAFEACESRRTKIFDDLITETSATTGLLDDAVARLGDSLNAINAQPSISAEDIKDLEQQAREIRANCDLTEEQHICGGLEFYRQEIASLRPGTHEDTAEPEPPQETVRTPLTGTISTTDLRGTVKVKRGDAFVPLAANDKVTPGDILSTSSDGTVTLDFGGATVRIDKDTIFIVAEPERSRLELTVGSLWAKVKKGYYGRFEVKAGGVVNSVRGTEFVVKVDTEQQTTTYLQEGSLALTAIATNETTLLAPQEKASASANGAIVKSVMTTEEWTALINTWPSVTMDPRVYIFLGGLFVFKLLCVFFEYKRCQKKLRASATSNAFAVSGLIFGMLSIPFMILPFIGLPLAIAAVIFSRQQKKFHPTRLSSIVSVLGIISVTLNILAFILLLIGVMV